MAALDVLQSDLETLAFEAKASLPAVHEGKLFTTTQHDKMMIMFVAAEIALERLKSSRLSYEARVEQARSQSNGKQTREGSLEDLVRPFLLTCNHKTAGKAVHLTHS